MLGGIALAFVGGKKPNSLLVRPSIRVYKTFLLALMVFKLIDITIPCYNSDGTITEVLDSLYAQTFDDFHIYIINNASTDKTLIKIKSHPIFNKITLLENDRNIGFVRNVRKALSCGVRKYTALCSSNDVLYPRYLESLLSLHNEKSSLSYALCDFYINDRFSKSALSSDYFDTQGLSSVDSCNMVMKKFTYSAPFWGLYKKDAITKMSPFSFNRGADHVYVAEAALYGEIRQYPKSLFKRNYPQNRTIDTFSLMENDQQLTPDDVRVKFGWHFFPYVSMLRSHHNMLRRAFVSNSEKEQLLKSSVLILTQRYQRQITQELVRFIKLKDTPPKGLLERQYFCEVEAYMSFIKGFLSLEKR